MGIAGQDVTTSYNVSNLKDVATVGNSWIDSMYLSRQQVRFDRRLSRRKEHVGIVDGLSSYSETLTAPLPGALLGDYPIIIISDSRGLLPDVYRENNSLSSNSTITVDTLNSNSVRRP